MSADLSMRAARMERLSALVDGELDEATTATACSHWRDDSALRASWHEYQLIGDLLRSDDLVSTPQRDAAFLVALRLRLADEPVVLAPQALQSSAMTSLPVRAAGVRRSAWSWRASSAVAAGFVAVAGVVMVMRGPAVPPGPAADTSIAQVAAPVAATAQPVVASTLAAVPAATAELPVLVANGKLIRDARLDRYLSAHQQFAGSAALGVPSAYLRSATADAANR